MPVLGLGAAKIAGIIAALALAAAAFVVPDRVVAICLVSVAIVIPLPDLWPHYLLFPFVALWVALLRAWARAIARRPRPDPTALAGVAS